MNAPLILKKSEGNDILPKNIKVIKGLKTIAFVYCDGLVTLCDAEDVTSDGLKMIANIADNFWLFYENIK